MSFIDGETGLPLEAAEKIKKKIINQESSIRLVMTEEEKKQLIDDVKTLVNKVDRLLLEVGQLKEQLERLARTDSISS